MMTDDQLEDTLAPLLEESRRHELITRTRAAIVIGAIVVLMFWALDWAMQPAFVWKFLVIRLAIVVGFLSGAVAIAYTKSIRALVAVSQFVVLVAVLGVSLMHAMVGPEAQYFYGVLMAVFVAAVFMPWRTIEMVVFVLITLLMFSSLQVLWSDGVALDSTFLPAFFLVGTGVMAVAAARVTTRLRESDQRLRLQLEGKNRELETMAQQKDRFFSNVSHELRTPLTLILAPLDRLSEMHHDPATRELLRAMTANARRLLRQVNALLDLSKADAGRLRLNLATGNIGALAERLVNAAKPYATQKGVDLVIEGTEWVPSTPFDHDKIEIVIANLLSNALKFTPRNGSVRVVISQTQENVVVDVRDTGQGIPPEDHEKIFERFHQVDSSERRMHEGTGLGLSLALDLAKLHGGQLLLIESSSAGSLFRAIVPRAPRDQGEERRRRVRRKDDKMALAHLENKTAVELDRNTSVATLFADLRTPAKPVVIPSLKQEPHDFHVLLIEDNDDLRAFVASELSMSYRVTVARDGEEGLAAAREHRPNVIVTDAMMPKLDGVSLCRQLRDDPSFATTAIIMLTARTGIEAVTQGLSAGADDYLTKPFEGRELVARIEAQLRSRRMERSLIERETRLIAIGTMASSVVHDVRNGLTGLLAYADLARSKETDAENTKDLDSIVALAMRLNRSLQDILDFARGGAIELRASAGTPRAFWNDVTGLVRKTLQHARIALEVTFEGNVDAIATFDNDRMHRAVENLLLNARDACTGLDKAVVKVAVHCHDQEMHATVDDSGPGIPDGMTGRLFTTFATSGKLKGTGLGLATVRNVLRAHGGDIEAEAHGPLGGARFHLWIPMQPKPAVIESGVVPGR